MKHGTATSPRGLLQRLGRPDYPPRPPECAGIKPTPHVRHRVGRGGANTAGSPAKEVLSFAGRGPNTEPRHRGHRIPRTCNQRHPTAPGTATSSHACSPAEARANLAVHATARKDPCAHCDRVRRLRSPRASTGVSEPASSIPCASAAKRIHASRGRGNVNVATSTQLSPHGACTRTTITTQATTLADPILALDLGKDKSVAGLSRSAE